MKMECGSIIKKYRLKLNWTQAELAEKLSVTTSAVSKWENNANVPDWNMLIQISTVLHIPMDEMFDVSSNTDPAVSKAEIISSPKKYLQNALIAFSFLLNIILLILLIIANKQNKPENTYPSSDSDSVLQIVAYRTVEDELIRQEVYEMAVYCKNISVDDITPDSLFVFTCAEQWKTNSFVSPDITTQKISFYNNLDNACAWGTPLRSIYTVR